MSIFSQSLLLAGRLNEAYEVLQKAVELDRCASLRKKESKAASAAFWFLTPSFPTLACDLKRSHPDVANNLGLAYLGLGKIDREASSLFGHPPRAPPIFVTLFW